MTIMIKDMPREHDEMVLEWVRLRAAGVPASTIARRYGANAGIIDNITNNVFKADIRESGEPEGRVRAGYWPTR